ncbi:hypothetical protein BVX98_01715, partial [bacterium F11]
TRPHPHNKTPLFKFEIWGIWIPPNSNLKNPQNLKISEIRKKARAGNQKFTLNPKTPRSSN